MSPPEFLRESLVEKITFELARTGLQPQHLAIEITETVMIEDMPNPNEYARTAAAGHERAFGQLGHRVYQLKLFARKISTQSNFNFCLA